MLDIPIGKNFDTNEDLTISSDLVSAVVFPCSSFESHTLWKELQDRWGFTNKEIVQPKLARPFLVDWVHFLGEKKPIEVLIWCWNVKGVWLCFVEPHGDIFSYNLVEDWLHGHFNCKYDRGTRRAFFDPFNFHNCVTALKEAQDALIRC